MAPRRDLTSRAVLPHSFDVEVDISVWFMLSDIGKPSLPKLSGQALPKVR